MLTHGAGNLGYGILCFFFLIGFSGFFYGFWILEFGLRYFGFFLFGFRGFLWFLGFWSLGYGNFEFFYSVFRGRVSRILGMCLLCNSSVVLGVMEKLFLLECWNRLTV